MKKVILLAFMLCSALAGQAQESRSIRQKEIGLNLWSLNYFGASYRFGTQEAMWRLNSSFISGDRSEQTLASGNGYTSKSDRFNIGVSIGQEQRRELADKFELRYGADVSLHHGQSSSFNTHVHENIFYPNDVSNYSWTFSPGLNLVLGVNYVLNSKFIIGAELLPGINYTVGKHTRTQHYVEDTPQISKSDISQLSYGMSSSSVMLSFMYRFQ